MVTLTSRLVANRCCNHESFLCYFYGISGEKCSCDVCLVIRVHLYYFLEYFSEHFQTRIRYNFSFRKSISYLISFECTRWSSSLQCLRVSIYNWHTHKKLGLCISEYKTTSILWAEISNLKTLS